MCMFFRKCFIVFYLLTLVTLFSRVGNEYKHLNTRPSFFLYNPTLLSNSINQLKPKISYVFFFKACDYNVRKTTKTYLKMQLLLFYFFPFQPLFVSTPNDSSQTGDIASSGDNSSNREQVKLNNASVNADQFDNQLISQNINAEKDSTECVVCQNNAVTIAILPCRHTCVCDNCLEQLEKCPMCRGYIFSYFRISRRNSSQHSSRRSSSEVLAEMTNESRWECMNRRLNELLGFQ